MAWKTETSYCEKQIIAPECLESKLFEKKGLIMHYESQVEEKNKRSTIFTEVNSSPAGAKVVWWSQIGTKTFC